MLALVRVKIAVPRTEGQTVRLAEDRTNADSNRQVEIAHQLLDDAGLLIVLLSEISNLRLDDMKKLEHDGCYATKMARAGCPEQTLLQPLDVDPGLEVW